MTLVSGQVVTSCLHGCKFFVTRKIRQPSFPARLDPVAANESPHTGSVIPAWGDGKMTARKQGLPVAALDEFPRQHYPQRKQSQERARSGQYNHPYCLLTSNTKSMVIVSSRVVAKAFRPGKLFVTYRRQETGRQQETGRGLLPGPFLVWRHTCPSRRRDIGAMKGCPDSRMPADRVRPDPYPAPLPRGRRGLPW